MKKKKRNKCKVKVAGTLPISNGGSSRPAALPVSGKGELGTQLFPGFPKHLRDVFRHISNGLIAIAIFLGVPTLTILLPIGLALWHNNNLYLFGLMPATLTILYMLGVSLNPTSF